MDEKSAIQTQVDNLLAQVNALQKAITIINCYLDEKKPTKTIADKSRATFHRIQGRRLGLP